MNNITPKQKEYIEIDEDFKCYTGRSKRLIPLVKHFKFEYLESLTDELSSFSFLKLNFGIYTLNYIKKIEENLPIFNEIIENDIKDRGYPKEKIETIKRVQSDLIIEINNAKSKAEKTSNKSSKKDKPKPNFEDFFDERYKHLANKIFDEFKGYEGKNLAMLIHILIEKRIIKTRRNSLSPLRFSELLQNKSINNEAVNKQLKGNNFKIALGKYPDDYLYVEYKVNDIIQ
jgi:hypothetical protein